MSASLVLVVVMAVLYACGIYLMLERSLTRVLVGFLLAANATTLLLLIVAGPAGSAPIVDESGEAIGIADPLPQALVLTAIVITFGVTAFLLALIYRSWRLANEDVVADDRDDVAMRSGLPTVHSAEDIDDGSDEAELATEFGDELRAEDPRPEPEPEGRDPR